MPIKARKIIELIETADNAREIIRLFTEGILSGSPREVRTEMELFEEITENCAYILTTKLVEGACTPMEYIKTTNALARILDDVFFKGN